MTPSRTKTLFHVISYTYQKDRIHKSKFSKVSSILEEENDPENIPNKVVSFRVGSGIDPCCMTCKRPNASIFMEYKDEVIFWCDFMCFQEFKNTPMLYYNNKYDKLKIRVKNKVALVLMLLAPLLSAYIFTLSM